MKRITVIAASVVGIVALLASPAAAGKAKPDAFVKENGGEFVGKNVYSPPSPVIDQSANTIGDGTFTVKVKNRGTQRDTYTIDGFGGVNNATREITYKGEDVTTEVLNGELKLKRIDPGETSKPITIVHNVGGIGSFANTQLTATSRNNPNKSDEVAALSVGSI